MKHQTLGGIDVALFVYACASAPRVRGNIRHAHSKTKRMQGIAVLVLALCFQSPLAAIANSEEWIEIGNPSSEDKVRVTLAIKQTNVEWLETKLNAVSYPDSPEYGKYLNFDEIARRVHGRPESVQALVSALESFGVSQSEVDFTLGMDFAVTELPVRVVEAMFSTKLHRYRHVDDRDWTITTAADHTLPAALLDHLDFVSGITGFPRANRVCPRKSSKLAGGVGTTPQSIYTSYKINYTASSQSNSQAVASFLKQYFDPKDLADFQKKFDLPAKPIVEVIGVNDPNNAGIEAELDVQYISALGKNVPTWFISISTYANKGQEDFLSWIVAEVNRTNSPWVHSVSYGDYEQSIPNDYQFRVDAEFMKFGVSGRTVLIASGDEGAHCQKGQFVPEWPTCSPYITSVGGTTSLTNVWSDGGGGFSNDYNTPDYQVSTVQAYLAGGEAPPMSYFNTSGRAYPDVSVFATDFEIIVGGSTESVDGTSCATPTFAGIVSLLNDIRLNAGKSTLGFINPLLYQTLKGQGFIDITAGANSGDILLCPGFKAIKGWDPASGWGSPDFSVLRNLV